MMNGTVDDIPLDCGLPLGQCDVLRVVQKSILAVSITAELVSLLCIVFLKKHSFFHERIICHILVADLLTNVAYLSGDGSEEFSKTPGCVAQAFFLQLFPFAVLVWISILTVYVYLQMIKSKETSSKEWLYTLIGWLLPIVISCIPFIKNSYGLAETPFCWIKATHAGHLYRIFIYWVPCVVAWLGMVIICSYIAAVAKRAMKNYTFPEDNFTREHKKQVKDFLIPLAGYSGCFLLLNLSIFIYRLTQVWLGVTYAISIFHLAVLSLWVVDRPAEEPIILNKCNASFDYFLIM
ncbi:adhesion G-protein coupled receptor G2-like isoform X2 [Watersipora subatra]|uniref:adhesion G-protein coupled receptor G2-like isoform X2 n=1 Tax=Watersipora subatra TaxID=2589382 RepID=UPI00355B3FBD